MVTLAFISVHAIRRDSRPSNNFLIMQSASQLSTLDIAGDPTTSSVVQPENGHVSKRPSIRNLGTCSESRKSVVTVSISLKTFHQSWLYPRSAAIANTDPLRCTDG